MVRLRYLTFFGNYLVTELSLSIEEPQLHAFLAKHKQIIETVLDKLLPREQTGHSLFAAMRYSALNNGKRLRPALVYATGQALQTPIELLHAAAASVELIHCYSLIHDDLPAMDDDDLRRGVPTCHKAYDEATAILAGDALQSLAFQVLSDPELNPVSPQQQIAMVAVLAKAIGAIGMILGQAEDMAAERTSLSLTQLCQLHNHKTGALFCACIELCYIASGKTDHMLRENLLTYGKHLGLAFQIQDDILDVTSDNHTLGKPVGSDLEADKSTFPKLLGLSAAKEYAESTLQTAIDALKSLHDDSQLLKSLAYHVLSRVN